MQSARLIKKRISTTQNISQITKAMEMVSASKMRKAQKQALSSKPYSGKLQETLQRIASRCAPEEHKLLQKNKKGKMIVMLVSSDRGLTGGMITNLFRGVEDYLKNINLADNDLEYIIIGKKAREYCLKTKHTILAEFSQLPDKVSFQDTVAISKLIIDGYIKKKFKKVTIVYMDFVSTLVQEVAVNQLLPIEIGKEKIATEPSKLIEADVEGRFEYLFEPNAKKMLNWVLPYYIEMQVYQTLLEARASEHSARMVAMKNASENAGDLIDELTLDYNKSRQASITNELLDISSGANDASS